MKLNSISVIIPAFNEQAYIEQTVTSIQTWPYSTEIIVIDDGSTDKTPQIIKKLTTQYDITPIFLNKNQGKGHALMTGMLHADGEVLMFLDADLGDSAKYAFQLLSPIIDTNVDMAVAILPGSKKKAGFGLVKGLAATGIYYYTGYKVLAPLSGQRAIKKEVIQQIPSLASGFGIEVGLTIDVLRKGFMMKELELPLKHRETGRDLKGFLHRGREFMAVSRTLLYKWRQ